MVKVTSYKVEGERGKSDILKSKGMKNTNLQKKSESDILQN